MAVEEIARGLVTPLDEVLDVYFREIDGEEAIRCHAAVESFSGYLGRAAAVADLSNRTVRLWLLSIANPVQQRAHKTALCRAWDYIERTGQIPASRLDEQTAAMLESARIYIQGGADHVAQ